ncbi:hypothetical protein RhiJN_21440 [Ceratobasidium sp. AG-Ba]|nr:hypothetical protein RhiJN_21440 [Ceratobasidium sp. AG-Ba]
MYDNYSYLIYTSAWVTKKSVQKASGIDASIPRRVLANQFAQPPDEACIKFGMFGRCKKLKKEGERCEMHPGKHLLKDHVYLVMGPCEKDLKCVAKDGLVGKLLGTCQVDSDEEDNEE